MVDPPSPCLMFDYQMVIIPPDFSSSPPLVAKLAFPPQHFRCSAEKKRPRIWESDGVSKRRLEGTEPDVFDLVW